MKKVVLILLLMGNFIFGQELSYIEPKQVGGFKYRAGMKETGAIEVGLKESEYTITSEFSLPDGSWARLNRDGTENFKDVKTKEGKFTGETDYFVIERSIKRHKECIEVVDRIKNKTDQLLPLMIRHKTVIPDAKEHYLGGLRIYLKRGISTEPANPTTIVITEQGSIGILPLNDVFRVHVRNFISKNIYGIADNELVIRPKTEYEARWAVFLTEDKDYFLIINAIRRFLDTNFTIPGSFCFFTPRGKDKKIPESWLNQFKPSVFVNSDMSQDEMKTYFTNKNAYFIVFSFNRTANELEAQDRSYYSENPAILPFIKDIIKRIKQAYPDGKILPYYHSFINTEKNAKEKYKDSAILLSDGTQACYGKPNLPLFFPTLENSFGKVCEKQIDEYLDIFGADGIYWDEFEYSSVKYHYGEPHDGWSADIDPRTHRIIRLKSSVTLLTQPWRVKMAEKILNKKKLLVINGHPHTETIMKYKVPRFVETGSISNCARAHLFTPIALGDHLTERSEKDCYRKMLEALDYGCVYYWYYYLVWPEYPTLTSYMFPITPIEINKGYIIGKERIITKISGYFGWGDKSEAEAHYFDSEGREIKKETEKIEKDGKIYYKVVLGEYESCVLVRKRANEEILLCPYISDPPPSMDGDVSEWYRIKGIEIKGEDVVYGREKWKGEKDLGGIIWIGWRRENLYVAVEVEDDRFVQNMSGKDLWKGDHIEIYIDTKWMPQARGRFGEGQFVIGISPGNLLSSVDPLFDIPPESYIFLPKHLKGDIRVFARRTENGYSLEASIPFKLLGIVPREGMIMGIDICISDTDNPDIQEKMTSLVKGPWKHAERSRLRPVKLSGTLK